jgi:cytochrome P450
MTKISVRIMTRTIADIDLARSPEFLKEINAYFTGNFLCGFIMLKLPFIGCLRDVVAWPLWKYHQIFRQKKVISLIRRVVAKRMEDHKTGHRHRHFDAMTYTLDSLADFPRDPEANAAMVDTLSHELLQLIWAGGQSPAVSITTTIFKLLELPEYLVPLRHEAQTGVSNHGWSSGLLHALPQLDSFVRETHPLHPSFPCKSSF